MHEALFDSYPALKKLFEYFVSVCLAFTKLEIPILWYPPSGLSIEQRYLKTAKAKVSISVGHGKKKTIMLNKKLNQTDTRAQTQAIIPNIIHSMDSAHLILILSKIINLNKNNYPVISIHDCFGCLPNNMIDLENLVKLEFINLYSKFDFLEKFNSDLLSILDKNNIYYEVNQAEHKVFIFLDKSNINNLPFTSSNKLKNLEPL
jgi:DNA-directed RNA polymerase